MAALGATEVVTQPGGGQMQAVSIACPAHAAATATEYIAAFTFPFAGRLRKVTFTPTAAITGQADNYTCLNVVNCGAAGDGTTELGNVDFALGTDAAIAFPLVLATGLTTAFVDGATVAIQAQKVGDGLLIPAGTVTFLIDGGA